MSESKDKDDFLALTGRRIVLSLCDGTFATQRKFALHDEVIRTAALLTLAALEQPAAERDAFVRQVQGISGEAAVTVTMFPDKPADETTGSVH